MNTDNVQVLVTSRVAAMCRRDPASLQPETTLQELGLDSLGLTLIAAEIEDVLSCLLSQEQLLRLFRATSLRDVVAIAGEQRVTGHALNGYVPA